VSIILFVIGAGIMMVGSIKLGSFETEGIRVRVAGAVLCVPLILSQILYALANVTTNGNAGAMGLVSFLELIGMGAAAGVAYWLLMLENDHVPAGKVQRPNFSKPSVKPSAKPTSPKREHPLMQMLKPDAEKQSDKEPIRPDDKLPQPPKPLDPKRPAASVRAPRKTRDYPLVMTTAEAASYLNITEDALLELIESGQIAASRINYRYRISRTVLDDFIESQE
jgi:excisionase family DNA binding protein